MTVRIMLAAWPCALLAGLSRVVRIVRIICIIRLIPLIRIGNSMLGTIVNWAGGMSASSEFFVQGGIVGCRCWICKVVSMYL